MLVGRGWVGGGEGEGERERDGGVLGVGGWGPLGVGVRHMVRVKVLGMSMPRRGRDLCLLTEYPAPSSPGPVDGRAPRTAPARASACLAGSGATRATWPLWARATTCLACRTRWTLGTR